MALRRKEIVELGSGDNKEIVEVYEMTPLDLADVLPLLTSLLETIGEDNEINTEKLTEKLVENYKALIRVLSNCTSLKARINEYGISALIPVFRAFIEVNKPFLMELISTAAEVRKGTAED